MGAALELAGCSLTNVTSMHAELEKEPVRTKHARLLHWLRSPHAAAAVLDRTETRNRTLGAIVPSVAMSDGM